jgi:hypothetical protein
VAAPVELGLGALEVLSVPGTGWIVGVYPRAAYLRLPAGLVALTSLGVPSGPGHARSAVTLDRLRVDDRVVVTGSFLQAGPVLLDLDRPRVWRGPVPTAAELKPARRLALDLLEGAPPSSLDCAVVESAVEQVRQGDFAGLAGRLGGVGPGLTPAGDDCLAGILLIASICWSEAGLPKLIEAAASVETNDIARMFVHWAARGQSIAPVHRFLISAAEGDRDGAAAALDDLITFGHSSGADLALGLRLGLELLAGQ